MDGVLVIDKPAGPTSHDVVSTIRKALGEKKVGHTGTLDPTATGVLPLVLGKATKLARYFTGGEKSYLATFRLGITTTTLDAAGEVTSESPVDVTEEHVREVLQQFMGAIPQIPPMYSAKKLDGKRLYQLARQGVEIEREPKTVHIRKFSLVSFESPTVTVEVDCSAGTYVRALAHDVGEKLGCGAHLSALQRTAAGPFTLDQAISLEAAVEAPEQARAKVLSVELALASLPRIDLPSYLARMITSGYQLSVADLKTLDAPEFAPEQPVVLGTDGGQLIAVARAELASTELGSSRRDMRALKTERVLAAGRA